MVERALRKIAAQLRTEAEEPEISREAIYLAVRRIEMQAEMLKQGVEP